MRECCALSFRDCHGRRYSLRVTGAGGEQDSGEERDAYVAHADPRDTTSTTAIECYENGAALPMPDLLQIGQSEAAGLPRFDKRILPVQPRTCDRFSLFGRFLRLEEQYGVRATYFHVEATTARLNTISELFETGKLVTEVGTVLPLDQASLAHEMLGGAPHKHGKIVLSMA
jgi:hypothetical protein